MRARLLPATAGPGQARALALATVAMVASMPGQSYLVAVFLDDWLDGAGISRTTFSALYAAATVASALTALRLGRAADRLPLRRLWLLVALGLAAACLVASAATGIVLTLVALSGLRALGQGSFPLLGTLLVVRAFGRRRGAAMAAAVLGLAVGGAALPPLVSLLVDAVGWRDGYRLLAAALVLLVVPLALLVRDPRAPSPAGDQAGRPGGRAEAFRPGRRLPTTPVLMLLVVAATPSLVVTAVAVQAIDFLGTRGLGETAAAGALATLPAASAVGTLLVGAIADRVDGRTLLLATTVPLAAGVAVALVPVATAAIAGMALMGLGMGAWFVVGGVLWARTFGLERLGRLQGLSSAAQIAGAALGPLPLAVSLSATGSYTAGVAAMVVCAAVALVVAAAWRHDPA
ncbi:MAG: MFS transporter [Thermoleophilia bacterium]